VLSQEAFACGSRRATNRTPEGGAHTELRFESAGSRSRLQRADVNTEFLRQLLERQECGLALVMGRRRRRLSEHRRRRRTTFAVPRPERFERHRQQLRKFALAEIDRAA
jgi:hypothetical protein